MDSMETPESISFMSISMKQTIRVSPSKDISTGSAITTFFSGVFRFRIDTSGPDRVL